MTTAGAVRLPFADRAAAGAALAEALAAVLPAPPPAGRLVLGLPRGGVVVAAVVARRLGAPLDAYVVRKLGLPSQPELAMGAIASGGAVVLNEDVLLQGGIPADVVEAVAAAERAELDRRERAYRGDRPPVATTGRQVIVVDDGLATGATARAALRAIRATAPATLILAVPLAPPDALAAHDADAVLALAQPTPFDSVGRWYADFTPTTDAEVRALLSG